MLSPFNDSSVDNVLLQTSTSHILKQGPIDSLLHDTANIVSERTEVRVAWGHRSGDMKSINVFCSFQRIFRSFWFLNRRSFWFLQVVQKFIEEQTLGEVETWTIIWWPVLSEILVPRTSKIWLSFFKLQSIMSGMFFWRFWLMLTLTSCVPLSPGIAQKHTVGEVGPWMVVWWQVCQKYLYQKLLKSVYPALSYNR